MVDAVRIGYVTARDRKAFQQWQAHTTTPARGALEGAELERRVMGLLQMHPEYVKVRPN